MSKNNRLEILKILFENGLDIEKWIVSLFRTLPLNEAIYFFEQKSSFSEDRISCLFESMSRDCYANQLKYLLNYYQYRNFSYRELFEIAHNKDEGVIFLFFNKIVIPRKNDLNALEIIINGASRELLKLFLDKVFIKDIHENLCKNLFVRYYNDKEIIKKLLEKGINKNIQDKNGYTLLNHITCMYKGHYEKEQKELYDDMIYWIDYGMDVNIPCNGGSTPLLNLCSMSEPPLEIIKKLISKGADINVERKGCSDNKDVPQSLLRHLATPENDTPLYNSIRFSKNNELINLLLDAGANVNAFSSNNHESIIDAAIKYNCDVKIIDKILKSGVSDYFKKRAFLSCPSTAIFDVFVNNGIDINAKFTGYIRSLWWAEDMTPLEMACIENNFSIAKKLIDMGANTQIKDKKGRSLLSLLCTSVFIDIPFLEYLIKLGFDINEQDNDGNTPLMIRYQTGELEDIFDVLIKKGADINKRNNNGDNILLTEFAPINYRTNIRETLVKYGADVTAVNNDGKRVEERLISFYEKNFNTIVNRKKIDEEVAYKLKKKDEKKETKIIKQNMFEGKVVCFTGFKDKNLSDYIKNHGGKYVTTLTNDCNLLICVRTFGATYSSRITIGEAVKKVIPIMKYSDVKYKIKYVYQHDLNKSSFEKKSYKKSKNSVLNSEKTLTPPQFPVSDIVVCFTGVRDIRLESAIKGQGGKIVSSITKDCNYLIYKNDDSTKYNQAKEKNIFIEHYSDAKNRFSKFYFY